jgi:hypothetical protein
MARYRKEKEESDIWITLFFSIFQLTNQIYNIPVVIVTNSFKKGRFSMKISDMCKEIRDFAGDKEIPIIALGFYTQIMGEVYNSFAQGRTSYQRKLNLSVERLELNLSKQQKRYSCDMKHLCNIGTKLVEYLRSDGCVVDDECLVHELQYITMLSAAKKANAINTITKTQSSARHRNLVLSIKYEL